MSEAVTALGGAAAQGYVRVKEAPLAGMITLRGTLGDATLAKALGDITGAAMPKARKITAGQGAQVAWMAPDELLILCDYSAAPKMAEALQSALAGSHALAVVVSDARAMLEIEGDKADEVLAKLAPVDTANLAKDEMRRTRLAQVAAAVWRTDAGLRLVCFRSQARYVFDALRTVSQEGSAVY